jgi:hypothetical protein
MKNSPSPALVISVIALFVALGGTSYAAVKLNGKNIKKGTVSGAALKKNTLTGTQIKESKLGKVPSASIADRALSADNAASATTLAGIAPGLLVKGNANVISRNATIPTSSSGTVLEIPGFARVSVNCNGSNQSALSIGALTNGVNYAISTLAPTNNLQNSAGLLNTGASTSLTAFPGQKFQISAWLAGESDAAYEISGATLGCKTTATAIGRG